MGVLYQVWVGLSGILHRMACLDRSDRHDQIGMDMQTDEAHIVEHHRHVDTCNI